MGRRFAAAALLILSGSCGRSSFQPARNLASRDLGGPVDLTIRAVDFATGGPTWRSELGDGISTLRGVWAASPNDVYVVGDGGLVLHSTGDGQWLRQATGTAAALDGIFGASGQHIYAVGDGGTILHSDGGGSWLPQFSPTAVVLRAVAVSPGGRGFAVGSDVRIFSAPLGGPWAPQATDSSSYSGGWGVATLSEENAIAVGNTLKVVHSNSLGQWTDLPSPAPIGTVKSAIAVNGSGDVWVVGALCCDRDGFGVAFHGDGNGSWIQATLPDDARWPLEAVSASGPGTAFAVGGAGVLYGDTAVGFTVVLPPELRLHALHGVWSIAGHVFAVGDAGYILHLVPR